MRSEQEVLASATPAAIATASTWELYNLIGELVALVEQAREVAVGRDVIERAKGVVMAVHEVDDQDALQLLRGESHARQVELHDVALAVVDGQTRTDARHRS